MQKINFTCPECNSHKLYVQREETSIHPIETVFNVTEDAQDLATSLSDWAEDKEYLQDSQIIAVFCEACGESIVEGNSTAETTEMFLELAKSDNYCLWLTEVDEGEE